METLWHLAEGVACVSSVVWVAFSLYKIFTEGVALSQLNGSLSQLNWYLRSYSDVKKYLGVVILQIALPFSCQSSTYHLLWPKMERQQRWQLAHSLPHVRNRWLSLLSSQDHFSQPLTPWSSSPTYCMSSLFFLFWTVVRKMVSLSQHHKSLTNAPVQRSLGKKCSCSVFV